MVLILFEKLGDGGGVERRLVGEVLGAGRAADVVALITPSIRAKWVGGRFLRNSCFFVHYHSR